MRRAILYLSLLFLFSQCRSQSPLSGHIEIEAGWKPVIYLIQPRSLNEVAMNYGGQLLDSAVIQPDGHFSFDHLSISQPALTTICLQREGARFPNQLLDENPLSANYQFLVLEPEKKVQLSAKASRFQASIAMDKATPANAALLQLRDIRHQSFQVEQQWLQTGAAHNEATLLEQEAAVLRYQQPLMQFADTTQSLWAALAAIRWVSPESYYERIPEFLHRQCEKWQSSHPNVPFVQQLCQMSSKERLPVLKGDVIPDFAFPMATGDTAMLHTLLGEKLTVLDIWASWCMPCRKENRDVLAPLWEQYRSSGLQIIGYSIDSGAGAWQAAIQKDGAVWPQASHLTGDATPFMEALRITTIPANFILDANGKVIAKNLHGEALRQFIAVEMKASE